jgi:hypothetical protein
MTRGPMPEGSMIFGVGVNKSGTTSIAKAVEILGYPALHYRAPGLEPRHVNPAICRAVEEGKHPFTYVPKLGEYRALFDLHSVEKHFAALDAAFPASRYILHTRDLDSWLDSREQHVRINVARGSKYIGAWRTIDRDGWADHWHTQHRSVREYFRDRPNDLLEFDLTAGDGWEVLAPFLAMPVPDVPFPWKNSAGARTAESSRQASASSYLRRARWRLRRQLELLRR